MMTASSDVHRVNIAGPKTDPCGTPYLFNVILDVTPSMQIEFVLSVIYDLNQARVEPRMPNFNSNMSNNLA